MSGDLERQFEELRKDGVHCRVVDGGRRVVCETVMAVQITVTPLTDFDVAKVRAQLSKLSV